MPDTDEMQRFDALLEAMVTKPSLDGDAPAESDDDLREDGDN